MNTGGKIPSNRFQKETSFQKGMRKLRKEKDAIYQKMQKQAEDPQVQAYYADPKNTFDDAGVEVIDDYE